MSERCENCRFFVPSSAATPEIDTAEPRPRGACYRHPPVPARPEQESLRPYPMIVSSGFPVVYPHLWCGEYQPLTPPLPGLGYLDGADL